MSEVNLIGITQPNEEHTGCKTANELIAWTARVSNPSNQNNTACLLYTSPSPRDVEESRMPSSA